MRRSEVDGEPPGRYWEKTKGESFAWYVPQEAERVMR